MRCFFTPLVHCPPKGKSRKAPRLSPSKPSGPAWPLVPLLLERRSIYLSFYLSIYHNAAVTLCSKLPELASVLHFIHKRIKGTQSARRIASSREKPVPAPYHTNRALNRHVAYLPTYLSRLLLPPFSTFLTSHQLRDPCQDYRSSHSPENIPFSHTKPDS